MDPVRYDVIVAGAGAMGSAACFHLARRGLRVLGLDAHAIPNDRGSSHGQTRMVRLCYFEHPDYVPLLRRAYELWDELNELRGAAIFRRTGGLYIGDPSEPFVAGSLASALEHGIPHEMLDTSSLRARFPLFEVPDGHGALFEPNAGFVQPEAAIAAHAALATAYGAHVRAHEPLESWRADASGVEVRTRRGAFRCDRLVLCAGAWTGELLEELGVELAVTRQVVGWLWPHDPEPFAAPGFPVWAIGNDDGSLHYGFPLASDLPGPAGVKVARHAPGSPTTANRLDRHPTAADEAEVRAAVRSVLPRADGDLAAMSVCMYTSTPDGHFVIDTHPRYERVVVACGFSGHGFKFAPVVGEALADLVANGRTRLPIDFLRLARFRSGGDRRRDPAAAPEGRPGPAATHRRTPDSAVRPSGL